MATLQDILITDELERRTPRGPDYQAEASAYRVLAALLSTNNSTAILQKLSELALALCDAHSAGVSVLEHENGDSMFRWRGLAGCWAHYRNGGLPRNLSPCGVVVDMNRTLLVQRPGRHFPPVAQAEPELVEGLLTPFLILGQPVGTVWVLSHDEERRFDREDARIVEGLAGFAAATFMLMETLSGAIDARDELARSHARLLQSNDRLWARINTPQAEALT